jgi:hypothetical protein
VRTNDQAEALVSAATRRAHRLKIRKSPERRTCRLNDKLGTTQAVSFNRPTKIVKLRRLDIISEFSGAKWLRIQVEVSLDGQYRQ